MTAMAGLLYVAGWIFIMAAASLWAHLRISQEIAPLEAQVRQAQARGVDPDEAFREIIAVVRSDYCRRRVCFARWLRIRYLEMARKDFVSR